MGHDGGWRATTLGELCASGCALLQTGPFGSQLHAHDYELAGVPVIPTEGIGRRRLKTEDVPRVSSETANRLSRHRLRTGDILFARRGVQATGLSAIVEPEQEEWLCGTGAILLRFTSPEIDQAFVSFALSSDSSIQWMKSHAVGAVMPNLNEGILRSLPLLLPPLTEQLAISRILNSLDKKIELNRRMNETLEAMARAIFKSWFVDFDAVRAKSEGRQPPGMDAETAALFPDSFEDSPLGKTPSGWRMGKLADIAENPRRGALPEHIEPNTSYMGLEHMPRKSIVLGEWGVASEIASNKFRFRRGEMLFGKLRPYFHKVGVAVLDGVCSTDILVIAPHAQSWFGLVLGHVSSEEFVAYADAHSTGTKMPRTSWSDLAKYPLVIPKQQVGERFTKKAMAFTEAIRSNILQVRTLATIRDALLPKLLSGEIRVNDTESKLQKRA
jgi:type I restriction enzyme S subunit